MEGKWERGVHKGEEVKLGTDMFIRGGWKKGVGSDMEIREFCRGWW